MTKTTVYYLASIPVTSTPVVTWSKTGTGTSGSTSAGLQWPPTGGLWGRRPARWPPVLWRPPAPCPVSRHVPGGARTCRAVRCSPLPARATPTARWPGRSMITWPAETLSTMPSGTCILSDHQIVEVVTTILQMEKVSSLLQFYTNNNYIVECFDKLKTGYRHYSGYYQNHHNVRDIEECQQECSRDPTCNSFSYRYAVCR